MQFIQKMIFNETQFDLIKSSTNYNIELYVCNYENITTKLIDYIYNNSDKFSKIVINEYKNRISAFIPRDKLYGAYKHINNNITNVNTQDTLVIGNGCHKIHNCTAHGIIINKCKSVILENVNTVCCEITNSNDISLLNCNDANIVDSKNITIDGNVNFKLKECQNVNVHACNMCNVIDCKVVEIHQSAECIIQNSELYTINCPKLTLINCHYSSILNRKVMKNKLQELTIDNTKMSMLIEYINLDGFKKLRKVETNMVYICLSECPVLLSCYFKKSVISVINCPCVEYIALINEWRGDAWLEGVPKLHTLNVEGYEEYSIDRH